MLMTTTHIEGVPVPANEGDLPLDIQRDVDPDSPTFRKILRIRIAWHGHTIREQFPSTRSIGEQP